MNTNMYKNIASLMVGGSILLGAVGCTDKFEDFNTDPKAPTPEDTPPCLSPPLLPLLPQPWSCISQSNLDLNM